MKSKIRIAKIILFTTIILVVAGISVYIFLNKQNPSLPVTKFVEFCNEDSCHKNGLPYQDESLTAEARVDDLMSRMTITEKIGQMALIEKNSIKDPDDIARYGLGALLSGGGAKPASNTPEGWLKMVDDFKNISKKTRLAIPLLFGVDAIHGHSNIPGATNFPHFIGLGATNDPDLVKEVAKATAREVAATGIYWTYSPNLDVAKDLRWGRTYETFGSNPDLISRLGTAYILGAQSISQNSISMAATAKHYVGNGASEWNSSINEKFHIDQGNMNISDTELRETHLEPFRRAVNAGVKTVLVGLNKWNGEKVAFNGYLINDILKQELSFTGFVFSDWYGIYEKENNKYQALVDAINAGIDMIMLPFDYQFFSQSIHEALAKGNISESRLNDAVRRILKVKFEIGLFEGAPANQDNLKLIGSEAHRELARMAVRKSLVSLKNKKIIPISKSTNKILVAGSAADNIGKQSGGWTVEWQGIDGNWVPGTTILAGIKNAVSSNTKVEYDLDGNFAKEEKLADIGIAVVGESPYAEGWGDDEDPRLSKTDLQTISNLKKASKKIIVIIISGRPLNIKGIANDWDAIVAAWLPGSEGQGVADVLFGDYPFTGSLPVEWNF